MLLEQTGIAAAGCYSWSKQGLVLLEQTGIGAAGCYSWSKQGLVQLEQTWIGAAGCIFSPKFGKESFRNIYTCPVRCLQHLCTISFKSYLFFPFVYHDVTALLGSLFPIFAIIFPQNSKKASHQLVKKP